MVPYRATEAGKEGSKRRQSCGKDLNSLANGKRRRTSTSTVQDDLCRAQKIGNGTIERCRAPQDPQTAGCASKLTGRLSCASLRGRATRASHPLRGKERDDLSMDTADVSLSQRHRSPTRRCLGVCCTRRRPGDPTSRRPNVPTSRRPTPLRGRSGAAAAAPPPSPGPFLAVPAAAPPTVPHDHRDGSPCL